VKVQVHSVLAGARVKDLEDDTERADVGRPAQRIVLTCSAPRRA